MKEIGQYFSKGTGVARMLTAMLSTVGSITQPSGSSGKHSNRRALSFAAIAAVVLGGGLLIYGALQALFTAKM